jgi:hypothetical protein
MSQFSTPVEIQRMPNQTGYRQKNLFMGSCFTENMGEAMELLGYDVDINPFGILYNPVSISKSILRLVEGKPFETFELFQHNTLWHSYMHHGRFSDDTSEAVLHKINSRLLRSSQYIREAGFLFITLGTAWIYELKTTGEVVSNCHKVPAREFCRFRLSVGETVEALRNALDAVWAVNPELRVVFTVSPIRHTSDGATENQLSKATLLLAADALVKGYGPDRCYYFPSYELVMDELRDYRFYAEDMVHLSNVAVQFIWKKFEEAAIESESREISEKVVAINKALEHRPFNRFTPEHLLFLENTLAKIVAIFNSFPFIKLEKQQKMLVGEIEKIRNVLKNKF